MLFFSSWMDKISAIDFKSSLCLVFIFRISPNAKAALQRTTVPSCSVFAIKLTIALSNLRGNKWAMFPITLALSHFILSAFDIRDVLTKSRVVSSAIPGINFVANSIDVLENI